MDVVTFKFNQLDQDVYRQIRRLSKRFNDRGATRVHQWFKHEVPTVTVKYIPHPKMPEYIGDYEISMSREDYVEFCLKWL